MLSKFSYAFIIWAGASKLYGFPLGNELYKYICKKYANNVKKFFQDSKATYNFDIEGFTRLNDPNKSYKTLYARVLS
jgi:hypothetical protein